MNPFDMRDVSAADLALFRRIRRTVRSMPDVSLGKDGRGETVLVSAHMVCRALASHYPVSCRDGHFGDSAMIHSWLLTASGLLIDPCPPAMVGGPVMVRIGDLSPWRRLYREADLSVHFDRVRPEFDRHVAAVTEAVRRFLEPRFDF